MWQDLRFGARTLLKSPGFTLVALLTLALGIGANTTIFSLVNSILLRPLPYERPDRIVQVADAFHVTGGAMTSSLPKFKFLRDHAKSFTAFAAHADRIFQLSGPAPAAPAEVFGVRVSADFFGVFGVKAASGRTFLPNEDEPGAAPVAVISDALWRNRFASDPNVIGKSIGVNGTSTVILGVMPAGFDYPNGSEIWIPRFQELPVFTALQISRGGSYLMYYARLADGVDARSAQAEIDLLSAQYDASHAGFGDIGRKMKVIELRESIVSGYQRMLLVLLGVVAFVLLIACANVANLLLARAIARQREVAIRASLGASRRRLLVQFLTESVLLSAIGAGVGLALSLWGVRLLRGIDILPRANEIHLDMTVLAFTAALAVFTGIVFGLGPALHSARIDLNDALKAGGRGIAGGGRLRAAMIACEVALATILLAGSGLLLRSFLRLENVNVGFRPEQLVTMRMSLAAPRYPNSDKEIAFYDRVRERIAAIPGVRAASISKTLPVNGRSLAYFFNVEGRPPLDSTKAPTAWMNAISPEYFETMGIPLLGGRAFTAADRADAPLVAVINQGMARHFWPDGSAIGQHIIYSRESVKVEIVGIVGDVNIGGLGNDTPYDVLYVPYRQKPYLTMYAIAKGPASIASAARREINAIDPEQPVADVRTMEDVISASVSEPRLRTALISGFAALALTLAAIGIGGMVAWSVSQRTNEIGIRMALGARPSNILAMIVRQSLGMIGAGQLIGIAGSLALTRVLSSFLFGISAEDPLTFVGVAALLAMVALAACAVAARRALRVDPVVALRLE
jgi:putative ABC transport system permease protein